MEAWQPLAPTKKASGVYTRANADNGPSTVSSLKPVTFGRSGRGTGPTQAQMLSHSAIQPPSDPFPPVGVFPRSVAIRILSFLSLSDQVQCALAGRPFAAAVADESNWSRRLHALDWCHVDGLKVEGLDTKEGEERTIGRQAKRKPIAFTTQRNQQGLVNSQKDNSPITVHSDSEDDFGEFSGSNAVNSSFGHQYDKYMQGGSLASGTASVALGAGRPHPFDLPNSSPAQSPNSQNTTPQNGSLFSYATEAVVPKCSSSPSYRALRAYAMALRPYIRSLADLSIPSTNSLLFTCDLGLSAQAALLGNILRFISTSVGGFRREPVRDTQQHHFEDEASLSYRGQEAANTLSQTLLSSFQGTLARRSDAVKAASHGADTTRAIRRAEDDMQKHANSVWELGNARLALALSERDELAEDEEDEFGRMDAAKLYIDSLEVFSTALQAHNPLGNVVKRPNGATLDFSSMDQFITELIQIIQLDGDIIARVFPAEQDSLLTYANRVAQQVVAPYIHSLLDHVRSISTHLYLRSCAATFAQAWKIVDVLLNITPRDEEIITIERCEDVIYQMWQENMKEYLQTERRWVRDEMQNVTEKWELDNPAAVKRSVLSGFKDVLLLPVTVVPMTAGIVGGAVIRTAGTGLSSLNPKSWQSGSAGTANGKSAGSSSLTKAQFPEKHPSSSVISKGLSDASERGYVDFSSGNVPTMDSDDDEDGDSVDDFNDRDEWNEEVEAWSAVASARPAKETKENKRRSVAASVQMSQPSPTTLAPPRSISTSVASESSPTSRPSTPVGLKSSITQMQLLLSLDTALQVIHVNRDCLKRMESFVKYPWPDGEAVRAAVEEISLMLFKALGDGHIAPGFSKATKQITDWRPEEHSDTNSNHREEEQEVEPLVHFFELVHVGDTIAQMVQVYYDQEIGRHIDKNDFLNPVVKGRKRFESNLDEAVAKGLNAGVDLLLGQVEHIISTRQNVKDYCPDKGLLTDLSPTTACREAVQCLKVHCRMLLGTTDKSVLEVFYQEVGIRLYGIICKHLKKQVISLEGGFRLIADLNEYHTFVTTLKQPTLTADFTSLKMIGNLYIIDNPRELAKLARDANMFGGTLSPEDLYEFLQARADFRLVEKAIDKEMYGFKVSEDCCIA